MAELKFVIGSKRNPTVGSFSEFKGQKLFDLRKHFISPTNSEELIPTKKGISLNELQFKLLIESLNQFSPEIKEFFTESSDFEIDMEITTTIGREFEIIYENGKTTLKIDENFKTKLAIDQLQLFSKLLDSFYKSLIDVVDDSDEIDLVMDGLNRRINKIL
jgi:hypothetical protein